MYIEKAYSITIRKIDLDTNAKIELSFKCPQDISMATESIEYHSGLGNAVVWVRQIGIENLFADDVQLLLDGVFVDTDGKDYRCTYDLLSGVWVSQEALKNE